MTKHIPPYSPEVRARAVRMVFDHQGEHTSQAAAISSIAAKIGCAPETLRGWVRQAERDQGRRAGPTTAEQERIRALEDTYPPGQSHDRFYRQIRDRLGVGADLQGTADRPVDLLRPRRSAG